MIRIYVLGDLHLDAACAGYDSHQDVLDALAQVDLNGADYVVQLGDVSDPTGGPRSYRALSAFADWAHGANAEPAIVVGNHDRIDDVRARSSLDPLALHVSVCDIVSSWEVPECVMLFLPWLSPAHGKVDVAARVNDLLEGVTKPVIAFCHLDIEGVLPGSEDDMPRLGRQYLPPEVEDDPRIVAVMAGHYHKAGTVRVKTHVVGSLARLGMGDRDVEKSYAVVEVDGDKVTVKRVPIETRPHFLLRSMYGEELPDVSGAVVRLDVEVDAHEDFDAAEAEKALYDAGAAYVYPIAPKYVEAETPIEPADDDVDYRDVRAALEERALQFPPPDGVDVFELLEEVQT